ncbi:unnamed protein product [Orchesella dallaii]|uniref:C2H2-type domain-containing protein n=1 Tax=Orchesella dallaii TaxID=48710 RepID=A0ABP1SA96_9HEXA
MMKNPRSVCFLCLKRFVGVKVTSESEFEREVEKKEPKEQQPLLIRFFNFAQNYLGISPPIGIQHSVLIEKENEAFCEKCELVVINPICQLYLQLVSIKLRLSWELGQLGKLLHPSKMSGTEITECDGEFEPESETEQMLLTSLTQQLGIPNVTHLEGFRNSVTSKCELERKSGLPTLMVERLEKKQKVALTKSFSETENGKQVDFGSQVSTPTQVERPTKRPPRVTTKSTADVSAVDDIRNPKLKIVNVEVEELQLSRESGRRRRDNDNNSKDGQESTLLESGEDIEDSHDFEDSFLPDGPLDLDPDEKDGKSKSSRAREADSSEPEQEDGNEMSDSDSSDDPRFRAEDGDSDCELTEVIPLKGSSSKSTPRSHRKKGCYKCADCGNPSTSKWKLTHHMKECKAHIERQILRRKSGEVMACCFCHRSYSTQSLLQTHLIGFHNELLSKEARFLCEVSGCNQSFERHLELAQHLCSHVDSDSGAPLSTYTCDSCGFAFLKKEELCRHKMVHNKQKPFNECSECGKSFETKARERYHFRMVHKPTSCSSCEVVSNGLYELQEHMSKNHDITNSFPCPVCHKKLKTKLTLYMHTRHVHNKSLQTMEKEEGGERLVEQLRPHKCQVCSKGFHSEYTLRRHILNVHGDESHMCAQCGSIYKSKKYLDAHVLRQHPDHAGQGQGSFECAHCPAKFRWQAVLHRHLLKTHTDKKIEELEGLLECKVCGLRLEKMRACLMKRHMEKHIPLEERRSQGKMHICHVCGKEFLSIEYYNSHIVTHEENHTGDTHKCHICNKHFYYKHKLRDHLLTHQEAGEPQN